MGVKWYHKEGDNLGTKITDGINSYVFQEFRGPALCAILLHGVREK